MRKHTVSFAVRGTSWEAGGDPVVCLECNTEVAVGEECGHIRHTEDAVEMAPRWEPI